MSQPTLDGMPRRLYPAAPSRLTTYLDCPRRYRLAYLQRPAPPQGPPWGHYSVGASVHGALARWWALPRQQRTPEAGGGLLVAGWLSDGFRDGAQSLAARDRAVEQVRRYLTEIDPDDEPLGVERRVAVRTARASLWGRVDRIDDRSGAGVVVVDYKTGRSVLTVDDARSSVALAVYAAGAAHTFRRPCTRVELHHLPTGEVLTWDHTEESLGEHLDRADALAAELGSLDERYRAGMSEPEADEVFPAQVAPRCGWCDYWSVCRPGRSVPKRQPWAAVVESG